MAMLSRHKLSAIAFLTAIAVGTSIGLAADKGKELPDQYWRGGYFGPSFSLTKLRNSYNPAVPVTTQKLRAKGKLIGMIGGYNFLNDGIMYGLEGDISSGALFSDNLSIVSTLRGRIGKPINDTLFFATGGLGFAKLKKLSAASPFTSSKIQFGLVAGAGIEHILARAITGRLEYTYGHFFSNGPTGSSKVRLDGVHMLRASIAIHFRD